MTTPRPRASEPLTVAVPVEPIRPDAIRPDPRPEVEEFSVISLMNSVLRHRWLILAIALAGGAYQGWKGTRMPLLYTTEAQFMPKGSRGQSQIQGLAQQFGIPLGPSEGGPSPAFYVELLESRPLLAAVAERQYRVRTDSGLITGKGQVDENSSVRTGVITVTVHAKYPELAVQIAQGLLDQINVFNLNRRQEGARAERVFIEGRLAEAQASLSQAEDNLQAFLTENRDFRSSPTLQLEFDRLNRKVGSRQSLYNAVATLYEQAKIEEVRDLPVITVLEPPDLPIQPDPRGTKRKVILGLLVGLLVGIVAAFARDRLAANRDARSDEFAEFAALKRDAVADIARPWNRVSRIFSSRTRS